MVTVAPPHARFSTAAILAFNPSARALVMRMLEVGQDLEQMTGDEFGAFSIGPRRLWVARNTTAARTACRSRSS